MKWQRFIVCRTAYSVFEIFTKIDANKIILNCGGGSSIPKANDFYLKSVIWTTIR
jgi:hypothetical protein